MRVLFLVLCSRYYLLHGGQYHEHILATILYSKEKKLHFILLCALLPNYLFREYKTWHLYKAKYVAFVSFYKNVYFSTILQNTECERLHINANVIRIQPTIQPTIQRYWQHSDADCTYSCFDTNLILTILYRECIYPRNILSYRSIYRLSSRCYQHHQSSKYRSYHKSSWRWVLPNKIILIFKKVSLKNIKNVQLQNNIPLSCLNPDSNVFNGFPSECVARRRRRPNNKIFRGNNRHAATDPSPRPPQHEPPHPTTDSKPQLYQHWSIGSITRLLWPSDEIFCCSRTTSIMRPFSTTR